MSEDEVTDAVQYEELIHSPWTFGNLVAVDHPSAIQFYAAPAPTSPSRKRRGYTEFLRVKLVKPRLPKQRIQPLLDRVANSGIIIKLEGQFLVFRTARGMESYEEAMAIIDSCSSQYMLHLENAKHAARPKRTSSDTKVHRRANPSLLTRN